MSLKGSRTVRRLVSLDAKSLAETARLSEPTFLDWVERGDLRYLPTRLDGGSGKLRELDVPTPPNMRVFRLLNKGLAKEKLHHWVAHGGPKGRSSITSAKTHVKAPFVWVLDVTNCFPSVKRKRFIEELCSFGVAPRMQIVLADCLFCRGQIPQGCPTSNLALNLFFLGLDYRMAEYCGPRQISFTRLVDDVVIGAAVKETGDRAVEKLVRELDALDLAINVKKRERTGFQPEKSQQLVHSLEISSGALHLCDGHRRKANVIADKTVGACRSLQPTSLVRAAEFRQQLDGWFHYSNQSQDELTTKLACARREADRLAVEKLRSVSLDCKGWRWWDSRTASRIASAWLGREI